MEHCHRVGGSPQSHSHVAQLRQSGIGHHAFDIVLNNPQKTHEQGRDGANDQDEVQGRVTELKQRRHASNHKDAGSHHRCRMNQSRNRRGALHRVWQPDMQGELGRFAHGADKQADANHGDQHPLSSWKPKLGQLTGFGKHFAVIQRAGIRHDEADAQNKAKVTHSIDQECLHIGEDGRRLVEPEANQQIRHQTHSFPAEEQLKQVITHDQHEHGEGKQGNV